MNKPTKWVFIEPIQETLTDEKTFNEKWKQLMTEFGKIRYTVHLQDRTYTISKEKVS